VKAIQFSPIEVNLGSEFFFGASVFVENTVPVELLRLRHTSCNSHSLKIPHHKSIDYIASKKATGW